MFRFINILETERKNILGKTGCRNSVDLALWAVKEGLLPGFKSCKTIKTHGFPLFFFLIEYILF